MGSKKDPTLSVKIACTSLAAGKPPENPMSEITAQLLTDVASNTAGLPLPVYLDEPSVDASIAGWINALWSVTEQNGDVGLWARIDPTMRWPDKSHACAVIDLNGRTLLHCVLVQTSALIGRQEKLTADPPAPDPSTPGVLGKSDQADSALFAWRTHQDPRVASSSIEKDSIERLQKLTQAGMITGDQAANLMRRIAGVDFGSAVVGDATLPDPEPTDDAEVDQDGLERARAELDRFDEEAGR